MLTLHHRMTFLKEFKQWIIYEYDTCVGTVWACNSDHAIRVFMAKRMYYRDAGLFAVEVP